MAAAGRGEDGDLAPPAAWLEGLPPGSAAARLLDDPFVFDFFQAVRLLRQQAAAAGGPRRAVRFRAWNSLAFPPSAVRSLAPPTEPGEPATMEVSFFGLTGPTGALPRHYTEALIRHGREARHPEAGALRDWLDQFNDRLLEQFHRAWEKYRFHLPAGPRTWPATDSPFAAALLGVVGLGSAPLRNRLKVTDAATGRELAKVDDLAVLYYGGLFASGRRTAEGLAAVLEDFFGLPAEVVPFRGSWLKLPPEARTRLGGPGGNNRLGDDAVAGDNVWDVQGKVLIRLGPVPLARFRELLPDRSRTPAGKEFFRVVHLARFYLGAEFDFDVQLVLAAPDVPECELPSGTAEGPRLGWDCWVRSATAANDAGEAVFPGEAVGRI